MNFGSQDGGKIDTIDQHLRYFLLIYSYERVKEEFKGELQDSKPNNTSTIKIDTNKKRVALRFNIGSILDLGLDLTFFGNPNTTPKQSGEETLINTKVFKQML